MKSPCGEIANSPRIGCGRGRASRWRGSKGAPTPSLSAVPASDRCRQGNRMSGSQSPSRPSRNARAARFEPSMYDAACRPCLATIARPRSTSDPRWRTMIPTNPHSSRNRRQAESSHPSGISPTGFDSPRLNARAAHVHQGVSSITTVSARSSRSSSVSRSLPSAIQALPASTRRCAARHSSSDGLTQPGFHWYRSRWITGKPVFADSARENVLFPDPAIPMTSTRWPMAPAGPSIRVRLSVVFPTAGGRGTPFTVIVATSPRPRDPAGTRSPRRRGSGRRRRRGRPPPMRSPRSARRCRARRSPVPSRPRT